MRYLTDDQKDILRQARDILDDLATEITLKDSELEFYVDGMQGWINNYDVRDAAVLVNKLTGSLKAGKKAAATHIKIMNRLKEIAEEDKQN